jgi:hypothetical protein
VGRHQVATICGFAALVLAGGAGRAAGQDRGPRPPEPYSGLFGVQRLELGNSVDLRGSLFGVYEDIGDFELAPSVDRRFLQPGVSGAASGALTYVHRGDRLRFQAAGAGTVRDYSRSGLTAASYGASAEANARVGRDLQIAMNAAVSVSPFYEFAPFIDGTSVFSEAATVMGFPGAAVRNNTIRAGASILQPIGGRTSISAAASGLMWRFPGDAALDLTSWGGRVGVSHRITRGLAARLQYARDEGVYARDSRDRVTIDTIDGGLEYHDTLTFARRTALAFSTSTSAVGDGTRTHLRLHGTLTVTRAFRRTWNAWLGYARSTEFTAGFPEPLLLDAFRAGLIGRLERRLKWSLLAGHATGTVGFDRHSPFTAYSGVTRLDFAMASRAGLYVDYSHYRYRLPRGVARLELPPELTRQSVSAGLSLWLPMVTDRRKPSDPR